MAITLDATSRTDLGRGASRRLRRQFLTPAIIIGEGKDAISITLDEKKLIAASLKDEFYTNVELNVDGQTIKVKPVDIQRHPVSERILHIDFQRI
ncbi:MAG TPA: 50S ribosomal protein L25 [Succinivibrio sp.]|nr:50S ribosomal protein L25 [Succinivibrio sp.]